jgi:hypothetical protein
MRPAETALLFAGCGVESAGVTMKTTFLGLSLLVVAPLILPVARAAELQPVDGLELQPKVPAEFRNPWPAEWEQAFQKRLQTLLASEEHQAPEASWVYEKSGGGFMAFLKGRREAALAAMMIQPTDVEHTAGIDFYWCFHLEKQPRYYFQFGQFLPPAFMAKFKEGAKLWTAADPRPNLELVLQLDAADPDVVAHAKMQLGKMWRDADGVRALIAAARGEGASANKQAFAAHLESVLPQWPKTMPATTAEWRAWWKLISDGDWKIYEEYERRTNPRPHPKYGIGTGPVGEAWDPGVRGGWVDWRNTDNLRSMREVSVYLFAEETGNELVRKVYRERIRRTARGFYGVGNGEWDSPAYIGLTIQGYLMLYDFARDPEVRLLAKGILDYLSTATALKFFHGGASGPNTRDYGTWASGGGGGGSRAWSTWLPVTRGIKPPGGYTDMLFFSAYRPPAAVVALAGDEVTKPWEHLASHPVYNNWVPGGDDAPAYHETLYRSRDFQVGTQVEGGSYDGSGGKIVLAHPERGCDYFLVTSKTKGNPCVGGNDRIAQCRNALIWASHAAKDWRLMFPADAVIEREKGIVFLKFTRGWAAIHPLRCELGEPDAALIKPFLGKTGADAGGGKPLQTALPAKVTGDGLNGFAIELADGLHFADYAAFKAAVLAKAKAQLAGNRAEYVAASGARVALTWDGQAKLPAVERDGQPHDWEKHRALCQNGPATLGWKEGRLVVEAGGRKFTGVLDLPTGTYRFE